MQAHKVVSSNADMGNGLCRYGRGTRLGAWLPGGGRRRLSRRGLEASFNDTTLFRLSKDDVYVFKGNIVHALCAL